MSISSTTRAYDDASAKASDLSNKASATFDTATKDAGKDIEQAARSAADQGREAVRNVQDVAGNVRSAVDKSLKDQPMTTLLVAAAVGFVVGAIWKS